MLINLTVIASIRRLLSAEDIDNATESVWVQNTGDFPVSHRRVLEVATGAGTFRSDTRCPRLSAAQVFDFDWYKGSDLLAVHFCCRFCF